MKELSPMLLCAVLLCGCATAPKSELVMKKYAGVLAINAEGKTLNDARECFKTALLSSSYIHRSWDNFSSCAKMIPGLAYYQGDAYINPKYADFLTAAKEEGFLPTSIGSSSFAPGIKEDVDFNSGPLQRGWLLWLSGRGYPENWTKVNPGGETILHGYKLIGENWIVLEEFDTYLSRDSFRH